MEEGVEPSLERKGWLRQYLWVYGFPVLQSHVQIFVMVNEYVQDTNLLLTG